MEQVLELRHIYYSYHTPEGETPALADISFSLSKGEFIAIVGPSGCGKSTLLSVICGLLSPEKGLIRINGKYMRESTTNIGYMLQHDELFEWRTIFNNVILGLEVQHMLTAKTKEKAGELLDLYGLGNFKNSRPLSCPAACGNVPLLSAHSYWIRIFCFWMNHSPRWITRPDSRSGMILDRSYGKKAILPFWSPMISQKQFPLLTG